MLRTLKLIVMLCFCSTRELFVLQVLWILLLYSSADTQPKPSSPQAWGQLIPKACTLFPLPGWTLESVLSLLRNHSSVQFSSVAQLCPTLWDPMNRSTPGLLSITNSRTSLRFTFIESVMPSSHLILCRPLLLLPPIPPSIRVFSNESTLHMRWPKY